MPWLTAAYPPHHPARYPYLRIRPLAPGETEPLLAVFAQLGPVARLQRYHAPWPHLPERMLRALADVHPQRHVALLASQGDRPVAIGRWQLEPAISRASDQATGHHPSPTAEVAIEVVDRLHGLGVGSALLGELAVRALRAGVETFAMHVREGNTRAQSWLETLAAQPDPAVDGRWSVPVSRVVRQHPLQPPAA